MKSLGVCSWSLQPNSSSTLAEQVREAGLSAVQLALDPIRTGAWALDATVEVLGRAGIRVLSGMMGTEAEDYSTLASIRETGGVRPDATWPANFAAAHANAEIAAKLGLSLVTLHAGFLPEDSNDPERATLLDRLRQIIDVFDTRGIAVAFETGQETAATLLGVMRDLERPQAGVNFDPANMLLYDQGEPTEALALLSQHVHQIHIKDATRTSVPGTWGAEVPVGTGEVNWSTFFSTLRERNINVDLVIEREAGDARIADIQTAARLVQQHTGSIQ